MAEPIYAEQPLWGGYFEPVNTLTNVFFFIAAWCIWRHMNRYGIRTPAARAYLALVVCIGAGSTAWHIHQTPLTGLLDVGPILLLIVLAVYRYVRLLVVGRWRAGAVSAALVALIPASGWLLARLGIGGGWYAVLAPLAVLAGMIAARGGRSRGRMLLPLGVFCLSLTLRQLDHAAATLIPFGTHFLWHLLNSVVLYLLYRGFAPTARTLSSTPETW